MKYPIAYLLRNGAYLLGKPFSVNGWIDRIRRGKEFTFIDVHDGSSIHKLQCVTSTQKADNEPLNHGASLNLVGCLSRSSHPKQQFELHVDSLKVIGENMDPLRHKVFSKHRLSLESLRTLPHLRARHPTFQSIFRLRHHFTDSFHAFYRNQGFTLIHTPIITSNDCEGSLSLFSLEPKDYFPHPAYLTGSGQLHLEAISAGLSRVYTFGPTFRAENSQTRRHLAEFYMIEPEIEFADSLYDLCENLESALKFVIADFLSHERALEDWNNLQSYQKSDSSIIPKDLTCFSQLCKTQQFPRIKYRDAIQILQQSSGKFQHKPQLGKPLRREHELFLTENHFERSPLFVTHFPLSIGPFYVLSSTMEGSFNEEATGESFDLLIPEVAELAGGSLREHRSNILSDRLKEHHSVTCGGGKEEEPLLLAWYGELRQCGSTPHGGYGIGFERFLQWITGVKNIKDLIPFPRTPNTLPM